MGALLLGLLPGVASAAVGGSTTFSAFIGESCITGSSEPNASFILKLRNPDGKSKGKTFVNAEEDGYWETCIDGGPVDIGDSISTQGLANDRTLSVPFMSVKARRISNKVVGHGPANSNVFVEILRCDEFDCLTKGKFVQSNGDGKFKARFDGFNPRGGDYAYAYLEMGDDIVAMGAAFEQLVVNLGNDWDNQQGMFSGNAWEDLDVQVTLKTAGVVRGTGRATPDRYGYFVGRFKDANKRPVYTRADDKVVSNIAKDAKIKLPDVSLRGFPATERVKGHCFPNQRVVVEAFDPTGERDEGSSTRLGKADSNGNFNFKMNAGDGNPAFDLMAGDRIRASCWTKAGDQINRGVTLGQPLHAPKQVSGDEDGIDYQVFFGYNGTFTAEPLGLVTPSLVTNTVNQGETNINDFSVSGGRYVRFELIDDETDNPGAYDLDICVYRDPTGDDEFIGCSSSGSSNEVIGIWDPLPDTYRVEVYGYSTNSSTAEFTLYYWQLAGDEGNMTVTAPGPASANTTGNISLSFSGLAADTHYLGAIEYGGHADMPDPTIVRVDTPAP